MTHILFEQLENAGYLRGGEVNLTAVSQASITEIRDLAEESIELTDPGSVPSSPSLFSYAASLSLGGGRFPCAGLDCRHNSVEALGRFAALYSDRVYVHNFLADHAPAHTHSENGSEDDVRRVFADDLAVLATLRPLIETGRVVPISIDSTRCVHCVSKELKDKDTSARLKAEYDRLYARQLSEVTLTVQKENDGSYFYTISGHEDLVEHGSASLATFRSPDVIQNNPRLWTALQRGEPVTLSKIARAKSRIPDYYLSMLFQSIVFELLAAGAFGTAFLTDRPLHVEVLNSLEPSAETEARNRIVEKHLSTILPFVEDVDLADLLILREREEEAFVLFRRRFNAAIDEFRKSRSSFSERDARALYSEFVEPELARLEIGVRSAKRGLVRNAGRKVLGLVGELTFGLFTPLPGATAPGLLRTAGAAKLTGELAALAGPDTVIDTELRKNEMYFLWRVRQLRRPDQDTPLPLNPGSAA